jgi:signal peptidase
MKKDKMSFKETSTFRKILGIVIDTLLVILVLSLLFVGYGVGVNNKFYKLLVVTSGSMEPTFAPGDLIMIVRMDPKQAKVGDITTFMTEDGSILTHRIVEIKTNGEVITKGDANKTVDFWNNNWKFVKVETKYVFNIPKLGYVVSWWQGLFHIQQKSTGANLTDTEKIKSEITAGEWNSATQ